MMRPSRRGALCTALVLACGCSSTDPDTQQPASDSLTQPTPRAEGTGLPVDGVAIEQPSGAVRDMSVADGDAREVGGRPQVDVIRDGARLIRAGELPMLWSHGGSHDDSLMMLPMSLAADPERVVVYDGMDGRFTAYSASTGDIQWRVGRRGQGPDEYSSYVTLAHTPGGDFLALDWQNLRLTYIDAATGATRRVVRWRVLSAPEYACVTADDRLLTLSSRSGGKSPLIWLADTVATMEAPLPWPDAREAHYLATQSVLAAGPRGDCVLALRYGRGFARYNEQDSLPVYAADYVEPVPLAVLTREKAPQGGIFTRFAKGTVEAANAATVGEEEILIVFGGRSKLRGRVVDRYALADGDYLGSYVLPFSADGIALSAGRIFVIDTSDDYPAVRAFAAP